MLRIVAREGSSIDAEGLILECIHTVWNEIKNQQLHEKDSQLAAKKSTLKKKESLDADSFSYLCVFNVGPLFLRHGSPISRLETTSVLCSTLKS